MRDPGRQEDRRIGPSPDPAIRGRRYGFPAILACAVTLTYFGCIRNGFVWDDLIFLVPNEAYRNFDVSRMLLGLGNGVEYYPVQDLLSAVDFLLWGPSPAGFHLTNLLLMTAATLLVFDFIRLVETRLGSADPSFAAFAGTLLFALHPLRVHVVSFVVCRNVLTATALTVLAASSLVRSLGLSGRTARNWRILSVGSFALALLSKATPLAMPLALAALAWAFSGEFPRPRRLLLAVPHLVLSCLASIWIFRIASATEVVGAAREETLAGRIATALQLPFFYLGKTLWPSPILPMYPDRLSKDLLSPAPLLALAVLAGVVVSLRVRPAPRAVLAVAWMGASFLPVLHLVRTSTVASDRYVFLPSVGLAMLVGPLVASLGRDRGAALVTAAGLVLALLSIRLVPHWRSNETLWTYQVARAPEDAWGYYQLGVLRAETGQTAQALLLFQRATALEPQWSEAHNNAGNCQHALGRLSDAADSWKRAVEANPRNAEAAYNLGTSRQDRGDLRGAAACYESYLSHAREVPAPVRRRLEAFLSVHGTATPRGP